MGGPGSGPARGFKKKEWRGGVYMMVNKRTGMVYIGGSAKNIDNRISYHYSQLRLGQHPNSKLQIEFSEDPGNFTHEIVKYCSGMREVKDLEQEKIDEYRAKKLCYNVYNNYNRLQQVNIVPIYLTDEDYIKFKGICYLEETSMSDKARKLIQAELTWKADILASVDVELPKATAKAFEDTPIPADF